MNNNSPWGKYPQGRSTVPAKGRQIIATVGNDITQTALSNILASKDDVLIKKGGGKGLKIYEELMRDPHVHAVIQKRRTQLIARNWVVEPASDDQQDIDAAKFIEDLLPTLTHDSGDLELPEQRMSGFDALTYGLSDAVVKGYSIAEIEWMRAGKYLTIKRVVSHNQRRFVFDKEWKPRLLTQNNYLNGIELPPAKFIVHRHNIDGSDAYGRGLGHNLFWPVYFKNNGVDFWLNFLNRFGSPIPAIKFLPGSSDADIDQMIENAQRLTKDGVIAMPLGSEVDFLEAKRSGDAGYENWCRYWDEQISEAVLGETLSTNIRDGGSRAATEAHSEITEKLVDSDGDMLSSTLSSTIFRWLTKINFPNAKVPNVYRPRPQNETLIEEQKIKTAERQSLDLRNIEQLKQSGYAFKDEQAYLEEVFGAELVAVQSREISNKKTPSKLDESEEDEPANFAADQSICFSQKKSELELAEHETGKLLGETVNAWLKKVEQAIDVASSKQDFSRHLLDIYAQTDFNNFSNHLASGLILAHLLGRSSVLDEVGEQEFSSKSTKDFTFEEKIEFFKNKVKIPTKTWADIMHHAHDRAFIVAGAMQEDLLADLHDAVYRTGFKFEGGIEAFRKEFGDIAEKHGWTYTGGEKWRANIIYRTNMRTAYAAGRFQQMKDPDIVKLRPFWQYQWAKTRRPSDPREVHQGWDGLVLKHDDPFWDTHYPINDWGCSCGVKSLTAYDLERMGKTTPDKSPTINYVTQKDPVTGEMLKVPEGIGLGWAYAPGKSWVEGLVPKLRRTATIPVDMDNQEKDLLPFPPAAPRSNIPDLDKNLSEEEIAQKFLMEFGATLDQAALFRDKAGQALIISDSLLRVGKAGKLKTKKAGRETHMLRVAAALKDPDEIWLHWERDPKGKLILKRYYLRYDEKTASVIVFSYDKKGFWYGNTAFAATNLKTGKAKINTAISKRKGALIYRREEK